MIDDEDDESEGEKWIDRVGTALILSVVALMVMGIFSIIFS